MTREDRKKAGSFFTPETVASSLVQWVVRKKTDRLLDPSCGDGRFLSFHEGAFGVEQDAEMAAYAKLRSPSCKIHVGDFFRWALQTNE